MLGSGSLLGLNQRLEFLRQFRSRSLLQTHLAVTPRDDVVLLTPDRIILREINSTVRPAAFFSRQRAARDCLGYSQQRLQIRTEMPSRIKHSRASDAESVCSILQLSDFAESRLQVLF